MDLGAFFRNRYYTKPIAATNEIPHALPPFEDVDALIKMRANADTLIEYGGNQEIWAFFEDSLMRHCHLFLKRTKTCTRRGSGEGSLTF